MKNLILEAGFPQILADYPLIVQDNFKDAFTRLFKPYGDNLMLSGCGLSIAGSNYSIAAGYVVFSGEIMRVEAHTVAAMSDINDLIAESYIITLTNNPKPYLDGNTHPMVKETLCRFKKKTVESVYVRWFYDMKPVAVKLSELALPGNVNWLLAGGSTWSLAPAITNSVSNPFSIAKTLDGQLRMKGELSWDMTAGTGTNSGGFHKILTINDAALKPATTMYFTLPQQTVTGAYNQNAMSYYFELRANGQLWIRHDTVSLGVSVNFASVNLNIF